MWGEDNDAQVALGSPQDDLSLICLEILSLLKVAINTVYNWITDPDIPVLLPTSDSFK